MRIPRWLTIALLLCLFPACIFGSDDENPVSSGTASRTNPTPRQGDTATTNASQGPAATVLSGHTGAAAFVVWSPDGTLLATAPDGISSRDVTPRIWGADGVVVSELPEQSGAVTGLSWSADSSLLAAGSADGVVRIWDRDGTLSSTIAVSDADSPAPVAAVAWSPSGELLATAAVRLPDPATPGPYNTLPATVQLWAPDGSVARSFEIAHTFRGIVNLGWSDDGSRLAAGGNDLHVWDTSGTELFTIPGGEYDFHPSVAFSPDGNLLAFTDVTGTLYLHSLDGGPPLSSGGFGGDQSLTFSPDSALLAVATERLLLVVTADNPIAPPVQAVANGIQGAPTWSPDSRRLAVGAALRAVHLTDADGNSLGILTGCDGAVAALDWSPEGTTLAVGLDNGQVCLWDVATM